MFKAMQHCDFKDFPKSVKNNLKRLRGGKKREGPNIIRKGCGKLWMECQCRAKVRYMRSSSSNGEQ